MHIALHSSKLSQLLRDVTISRANNALIKEKFLRPGSHILA